MMTPDELLQWTRCRPVIPFGLHISDGTVYEVTHPELCMPGLFTASIGMPRDATKPVYERYEIVSLDHIVRIAPASPATAASA